MRTVVIESPYSGDTRINTAYAQAAMRDCLLRGEAPFASHLLYTQVLDDTDTEERKLGIEASLALASTLDATVVYIDLGISDGMRQGIADAADHNRPIWYRTLSDTGSWASLKALTEATGLIVTSTMAILPIWQSVDDLPDIYHDLADNGILSLRPTHEAPDLPPGLLTLDSPKDES